MLTSQQWLLVLGLTVLQCLYVTWLVSRHRADVRLDREYERLCTETGREIF